MELLSLDWRLVLETVWGFRVLNFFLGGIDGFGG